ncbi:hypothetical protein EPN90_00285, partial [Patescibacteria group bacterium]
VRMKYLEELSYEEMAELLGKEKGALKVATFRAIRELRAALRGKKGGENFYSAIERIEDPSAPLGMTVKPKIQS